MRARVQDDVSKNFECHRFLDCNEVLMRCKSEVSQLGGLGRHAASVTMGSRQPSRSPAESSWRRDLFSVRHTDLQAFQ